jgi:hypothetical protein
MKAVTVLVAALMAMPLSGELGLKPLHPDETVDESLNQRFSADNALRTIATVEEMLDSLSVAVINRREGTCEKRLAAIEAAFRDKVTVGIANYPTVLEGAVRLQRLTIADLQHQLALSKHAHGAESQESVRNALDTLETARRQFLEFWESARVAD